jgi:hypothetical protein
MKNTAKSFLLVFVSLLFFLAEADAATQIMALSEVKAGMRGTGRSVFKGSRIEEFEVEILGILKNVQPKRSVILAKLEGQDLASTGVVQGMSGSPVYIDGKLIGALAFGFAFSKEPIAGITPIEEMLAIDKESIERRAGSSVRIPIRNNITLEQLSELYREEFYPKQAALKPARSVVPLSLPMVLSGFSTRAFDRAASFFSPLGFQPVRSGSESQIPQSPPSSGPLLQEGDAVGVRLIGGDLDLSAIGTVTYVDGNKILAFGHPFYNLGPVDYGLTTADVLAVMPTYDSSFKLASAGEIIGRITQDRTAGVFGEVGKLPEFIPLNVSIQSDPSVRKEFKINVIDDKILTAALVNLALFSLLTAEERSTGNLSVDFDGDVFLDKGVSVHMEDLFSGNYDSAAVGLSGLVAAVVHFLNNNDFEDVGIFRIDMNFRTTEEARFCSLDRVLLDKYEASPGERIQIKVFYRTFRGESRMEEVSILVPSLPAGSEFQLVVGDAASMQGIEQSQYRVREFIPRSFEQLIRILGNLRKNNRIYFKIIASKPGLFLKGEELPNLPPTLKSMFASPRASASSPTELTRSTLAEYQLPLPYVFRGAAVIPVRIRK